MLFPIRLNKYLRDKGFASRRESDALIEKGWVFINGKRAVIGTVVKEADVVTIPNHKEKKHTYLAYYKPRGLATQELKQKHEKDVITEWAKRGLFPVGRLDKDSEGLLILTDDGRLTTALLGGMSHIEKEYVVKTQEPIQERSLVLMRTGMKSKELGKLLPAQVERVGRGSISITLHEGKKHQIRVMLGELGYTVTELKRVRIGSATLGLMKPGDTHRLSNATVEKILGKQKESETKALPIVPKNKTVKPVAKRGKKSYNR